MSGTKSSQSGLTFSVARFQRNLRRGNYAKRVGTAGAVYLTSVLEYLTAEILELAGNQAKNNDRVRIIPRHIMMAIKSDAELNDLLSEAFFSGGGVMPNINQVLLANNKPKTNSQKASIQTSSENF